MGAARVLIVELPGWCDSNNQLWKINSMVDVDLEKFGIQSELLITQCVYQISITGGTTTQLTLQPKDAYLVSPTSISGANPAWNT